MIRYRLVCAKKHEFESWFQSSAAFDTLAKRKAVACPTCGSTKVEKALMAPSVKTTKGKEPAVPSAAKGRSRRGSDEAAAPVASLTPEQRAFVDAWRKLREHVVKTSEYVGDRFAEEARKIHYEESDKRGIHGEATLEEAKALAEEGIDVLPLPPLPEDRN